MAEIDNIDLLTQEECQKVRSVVYELKKFWIKRNFILPFYTLGAASYLDATKKLENYCHKATQYNPILEQQLTWLYQKLEKKLIQYLKAPTIYCDDLAKPGFHIYLSCKFFEDSLASIHSDLQYNLINWKVPQHTDFTNPISFTLVISLPKYGGGLNLWNIKHQEIVGLSKPELKQIFKIRRKTYYPYEIGKLYLHSGHWIHQVAPGKNIQPEDDRITLQGHGIFSQGEWQLYW